MLPDSARLSIKIVVDLSWWTGSGGSHKRNIRPARGSIAPRGERRVLARADPFLPFYARFARCKAQTPALAHSTYVTTTRWRAWLYAPSQDSSEVTLSNLLLFPRSDWKSSPCEMRPWWPSFLYRNHRLAIRTGSLPSPPGHEGSAKWDVHSLWELFVITH